MAKPARITFLLTYLLVALSPHAALAQAGPTPVFITRVTEDQFVDRIEALGTLKSNESVTLSASVTETINAIHFNDGQRVKQGDILVEMTSEEEHAQVKEARSTVQEAKSQFDRAKGLVESKAVSESVLDQRVRDYETAKARLKAIQSRLSDRLIVAPFDGVLGLRQISIGALVAPGDPIITIHDDSVMKLDFSIPATFLNSITTGARITARARAFPDEIFDGTVSSIDAQIDPITRAILVRALLPNDSKKLRPGLLMRVELLQNPRQVIVIPEEALIADGKNHFVFVAIKKDEGTIAEKRRVVVGSRRPGEAEIKQGLNIGEHIVTHGVVRIRDGSPITISATQEKDSSDVRELLLQTQPGPGA